MDSTNNKQSNSSKFILFSIILVTILVIMVIGLSFAVFKSAESSGELGGHNNDGGNGSNSNKALTAISMTYTEDTNGISIQDALPISDEVGKALSGKGEYFDFTISTKVSEGSSVTYEIAAIKDKESTIDNDSVKLYLEKQVSGSYEQVVEPTVFEPVEKTSKIGSPKNSMVLYKVKRKKTGTDNYRLRMWLKEDTNVEMDQIYTVKINVYGKAS